MIDSPDDNAAPFRSRDRRGCHIGQSQRRTCQSSGGAVIGEGRLVHEREFSDFFSQISPALFAHSGTTASQSTEKEGKSMRESFLLFESNLTRDWINHTPSSLQPVEPRCGITGTGGRNCCSTGDFFFVFVCILNIQILIIHFWACVRSIASLYLRRRRGGGRGRRRNLLITRETLERRGETPHQ